MIDEKVVLHLAKLARVGLTEDEIKRFAKDLSGVFEYMEVLKEINTDELPEVSQVNGLENVMEEDLEVKKDCEPAELIAQSPNPIEMGQIQVKKII